MKKLLYLFFLAFVVISCNKKSEDPAPAGNGTNNGGSPASKCNLVKQTITYPGQSDETIYTFEYDAQNHLTKTMVVAFKGRTQYYEVHSYNGDLRIKIEMFMLPANTLYRNFAITYNAQGKVTTETSTSATGQLIFTRSYEYDAQERLIKYMHMGSPASNDDIVYVYEYDGQGRRTKMSQNKPGYPVSQVNTYEYTGAGRLYKDIETYPASATNPSYYRLYEYNIQGKEIKNSYFESTNKLISYIATEYDSKGNKVKVTEFTRDNEVIWTSAYEYDCR